MDDYEGIPEPQLPSVLREGRTPAQWVELLARHGIELSERTLREKANRLGACYKIGRVMLITVEHLDTIVRQGRPSGSSQAARPSQHATTEQALSHLQDRAGRSRERHTPTQEAIARAKSLASRKSS